MIPALVSEPAGTASWSLPALRAGWGASGGRDPACCSARFSSAPDVGRERRINEVWPQKSLESAVSGRL